jgi:hypothetical protein
MIALALACNALALLVSARTEVVDDVAHEEAAKVVASSAPMPPKVSAEPMAIARAELRGAAAPEVARPNPLAQASYQKRPPGEWEGMLVDLNNRPSCSSTERCAFGLSCKEGRCLPCAADNECLQGEACVHDHCLPKDQVECRKRADCAGDSQCIISGYSMTIRGNEAMKSSCISLNSGASHAPRMAEAAPPDNRTFEHEKLMQEALKAIAK